MHRLTSAEINRAPGFDWLRFNRSTYRTATWAIFYDNTTLWGTLPEFFGTFYFSFNQYTLFIEFVSFQTQFSAHYRYIHLQRNNDVNRNEIRRDADFSRGVAMAGKGNVVVWGRADAHTPQTNRVAYCRQLINSIKFRSVCARWASLSCIVLRFSNRICSYSAHLRTMANGMVFIWLYYSRSIRMGGCAFHLTPLAVSHLQAYT